MHRVGANAWRWTTTCILFYSRARVGSPLIVTLFFNYILVAYMFFCSVENERSKGRTCDMSVPEEKKKKIWISKLRGDTDGLPP